MNYPKVSIVTPSFNQGNFIEQTILSILDQEYPNLEYIIIDGGSSDETLDIIKKYENRLTYWVSEKDKGQSDAINKGLAHCTGDIFNWVNSDDFLEPNSLHFIAQEYMEQPFTALCGRVNVLDESVLSHVRKPSYLALTKAETIADFNINQEGTWWSLDAVKQLRGVNTDFKYIMDLDLWIRALLLYDSSSFRSTGQILSNFRRHADAKSTQNAHLSDTENGFIIEQFELFTALLPNSCSFKSYFSLFNHILNEEMKEEITSWYLFCQLKKSFYTNQLGKTKLLFRTLKSFELPNFSKDLRYIRRKLFLKKLFHRNI
jgi:glycosyltransferase involved in cell wall biosynthesis